MPAKRGDESRHVVKLASHVGQPCEILEVHADPVFAIQKQSRLDDAAAKERGSRWNVAAEVQQNGGIEVMFDLGADDSSVAVHKDAVTMDDVGLRVLLGSTSDGFQSTGQVVVVGIQPAHQVAGGAQESLVDGIGLPIVLAPKSTAHTGSA